METTETKPVSYKELGFSNTREMFKAAMKGGYAVPAYNFNNMEQIQAIITACMKSRSPVILQTADLAARRSCSGGTPTAFSILPPYLFIMSM